VREHLAIIAIVNNEITKINYCSRFYNILKVTVNAFSWFVTAVIHSMSWGKTSCRLQLSQNKHELTLGAATTTHRKQLPVTCETPTPLAA